MNSNQKKPVNNVGDGRVTNSSVLVSDEGLNQAINYEESLRDQLLNNQNGVITLDKERQAIEDSIKALHAHRNEVTEKRNRSVEQKKSLESALVKSQKNITVIKQALQKQQTDIANLAGEQLSKAMRSEAGWSLGGVDLPWISTTTEKKWLQVFGSSCFILLAMISIIVPYLETPEVSRQELESIPPQLARILNEKPNKQITEELLKPEPDLLKEQEQEQVIEKSHTVENKNESGDVASISKKERQKQKPKEIKRKKAQEIAKTKGVLRHTEALAKLRSNVSLKAFNSRNMRKADVKTLNGQVKRDIIARLPTDSNKIFSSQASLSAAQVGIATGQIEYQSAAQWSALDEIVVTDFNTEQDEMSGDDNKQYSDNTQLAQRSNENIRKIFDRNKGSLSSLYQRELRRKPELKGKVVLELVILPSGVVSECRINSSELSFPTLERKLASRCRTFDFGELAVAATTVRYPLVFSPF